MLEAVFLFQRKVMHTICMQYINNYTLWIEKENICLVIMSAKINLFAYQILPIGISIFRELFIKLIML